MWYKKILSIVIYAAIIIGLFNIPGKAEQKATDFGKLGNSTGNLANEGVAAESDGWIYYGSDNGLWKIKNDDSGKLKLSEDKAAYINIMDNKLYYVNKNDSCIYSIKTDGSEKNKICDDKVSAISVIGNTIYYVANDKNRTERNQSIYSCSISGKDKRAITSENIYNIENLNVVGNAIYFISRASSLVKINAIDKKRLLVSGAMVNKFQVSGDWIYYSAYSLFKGDEFYRINKSGTQKISLGKSVDSFNISGNNIYYEKLEKPSTAFSTSKTEDGFSVSSNDMVPVSLNKMSLDGTKDVKLVDGNASAINMVGDWIFYKLVDKNNKLYKIKIDGTQKEEVE